MTFRAMALSLCLIAGASAAPQAAEPLQAFVANGSGNSVSGLSSGGFMAAQFQVAFSNDLIGAGIVAGGPFFCSEGSERLAQTRCMAARDGGPDATRLVALAREFEAWDAIDPLGNLARQRIFIFGGALDPMVRPPVMAALIGFYRAAGVPPERLMVKGDLAAGHGFPTAGFGVPCPLTAPPFVNDCDYDLAGEMLGWIYGRLRPPAAAASGRLVAFDQGEFLPDPRAHGLDEVGFVYVPEACAASARHCRLHIAFHGCLQGRERVGDLFATRTGLNRWADTNDLLILYPQAAASPGNPNGCWDWFGYDDPAFYSRSGRQMAAVKAMLDRIVDPGR